MNVLTVAVASDVHASSAGAPDTYVQSEPPVKTAGQHPLADLIAHVHKHGIRADYLLVPGDIADRSDEPAKVYAWRRIHDLADALGGARLLATPGNHDLTTHTPSVDPTVTLRNLVPSYPTGDKARDDAFWASGYALVEEASHRLLVINSCADFPAHPGADAGDDALKSYYAELDRGGISGAMHVELDQLLSQLDERPVNILLCHHHPVEHEQMHLFKDTYGPMHRGDELLRLLEEHDNAGRWLVIHGHKHIPLVMSTPGRSANAPVVMCAASIGGKLWHPIVTVTRNQFHLLDFELDAVVGLPRLRGTITSYMWGFGTGWGMSGRSNSGLPAQCGFGMSHDHRDFAESVSQVLSSNALEFLAWSKILEQVPGLRYQGPKDLVLFESYLDRYNLELVRDNQERIRQVAKKVGTP